MSVEYGGYRHTESHEDRRKKLEARKKSLVKNLADHVLYDPDAGRVQASVEAMAELSSEFDTKENQGIIAFVRGNFAHESANRGQVSYLVEADRRFKEKGGLKHASREDVQVASEAFRKNFPALEADEEAARLSYESAKEAEWTLKFTSERDVEVLLNDLAYRKAQREPDPEKRKRTLDEIDARLYTLGTIAKSGGKRGEYYVQWMLRKLFRDRGLDHVFTIEHGLVRDDMKYSTDLVMQLGAERVNIDVKSWYDDLEKKKEEERKLQAAIGKADLYGSSVFQISPESLTDAVNELGKGRAAAATEDFVRRYAVAAFGRKPSKEREAFVSGFVDTLLPRGEKKEKMKRPRTVKIGNFLKEQVNAATLRQLGLLGEGEKDSARVVKVKNALIEAAGQNIGQKTGLEIDVSYIGEIDPKEAFERLIGDPQFAAIAQAAEIILETAEKKDAGSSA